jgi:hypothetical protein
VPSTTRPRTTERVLGGPHAGQCRWEPRHTVARTLRPSWRPASQRSGHDAPAGHPRSRTTSPRRPGRQNMTGLDHLGPPELGERLGRDHRRLVGMATTGHDDPTHTLLGPLGRRVRSWHRIQGLAVRMRRDDQARALGELVRQVTPRTTSTHRITANARCCTSLNAPRVGPSGVVPWRRAGRLSVSHALCGLATSIPRRLGSPVARVAYK